MRIGRARKKRLSCLSTARIRFLFTADSGNAAGMAADFHALPGWIRSRRASATGTGIGVSNGPRPGPFPERDILAGGFALLPSPPPTPDQVKPMKGGNPVGGEALTPDYLGIRAVLLEDLLDNCIRMTSSSWPAKSARDLPTGIKRRGRSRRAADRAQPRSPHPDGLALQGITVGMNRAPSSFGLPRTYDGPEAESWLQGRCEEMRYRKQ